MNGLDGCVVSDIRTRQTTFAFRPNIMVRSMHPPSPRDRTPRPNRLTPSDQKCLCFETETI